MFIWGFIRTRKTRNRAPDRRLPGPRQYPLIGNMLLFLNPNFALLANDMVRKYGPIFKLNNSKCHYVVVGNDALIKDVLIRQGRLFSGRHVDASKRVVGSATVSFTKNKSIMTKTLAPFSSVMKRNSFTDDMTAKLLHYFEDQNETAFCTFDVIHDFSAAVISNLLIGERGKDAVDKISKVAKNVSSAVLPHRVQLAELLPWLKYLSSSHARAIKQLIGEIYDICENERKVAINDDEITSLMQVLFRECEKNKKLADLHVDTPKIYMIFVIFGGIETLGNFLHKALAMFAHYPTIQATVHSEIDDVIGDRQAEIEDMEKCPYTMATIQEVLRNCILAVAKSPHVALEDTTLGGYDIPAGTRVLVHTWAAHHDPDVWEDPYVYRPERFLDSDGQLLPTDHPTRRKLLPFNGGPRICPGKAYANSRLFCTLCTVLKKFTIKPQNNVDPSLVDPRILENDTNIKIRFSVRNTISGNLI